MKALILYVALAYGISWLIWLPLYAPAMGITGLPLLPYHHALGGLGPLLAAAITTYVTHWKTGFLSLWQKTLKFTPWIYLTIALLSPFMLLLLAIAMSGLIGKRTLDFSGIGVSGEFPEFNFITFFLYNLFFFGFGEEVGWRGFALPHLQKRFNALNATLLLTAIWALWHWPLFLYRPGYAAMDIGGIAGWTLSLLTGSALMTWLYNSSRGSILICAVFHATIDVAFMSNMKYPEIMNYTGMLITLWGIGTLAYFKPKNLSRETRQQE